MGTVSLASQLRAKLATRETTIGAMVGFNSPEIIEIIGRAGFDFVTIDIEHEPIEDTAIMSMIRAADHHGLPVIIRSPLNHRLGTLINFGAAGIQVPDVQGTQHLHQVIEQVKAPPLGRRPPTMLSRVASYGSSAGLEVSSADDPVVIAMVEDIGVAGQIDLLVEVEGIDAFYVGPADLRASMGGAPVGEVQDVINAVVEHCASAFRSVAVGVVSAAPAGDGVVAAIDDLASRRDQGINLFVVAVSMFLAQQLEGHYQDLVSALQR